MVERCRVADLIFRLERLGYSLWRQAWPALARSLACHSRRPVTHAITMQYKHCKAPEFLASATPPSSTVIRLPASRSYLPLPSCCAVRPRDRDLPLPYAMTVRLNFTCAAVRGASVTRVMLIDSP